MAKRLKDYEAKRNFSKTPEPIGTKRIPSANYPRFVVHKHRATHLHYDLRLEVDGVFKSWALKRGPSRDPAEKRLAVQVEDHPLGYGDFEGTIPKGQYGGGTVMIWDRGYWSPTRNEPALKSLEDGELKLVMGGEKLKGDWVLVRMKRDRDGRSKSNWLLIKHKDTWAKPGDNDEMLADARSVASGRTMEEIAVGKGKGPLPFIAKGKGKTASKPDEVWQPTRTLTSPAKISPVKAEGSRVLGVPISKPGKILWPDTGVTKCMLAEYLATVGPWMIEHLRGRPCSLLRAPDGINAETFFQRHVMKGAHERVTEVRVSGDYMPFLQIDSVEALVSMAQLAAVEFHPWNCRPNEPNVPGRLIFDLDPAPDVEFSKVVGAAIELKGRLETAGLQPYCKTTGGKGLHVVTPLANDSPGATWKQARMFAQAVCTQMAADSPDLYLVKMTKSLRKGRIYLDYLRNDRKSTAVAPLSPRARELATVSMPLEWRDVAVGLEPKRFTIATAVDLMRENSPWNDYARSERSLIGAIHKLIGRNP